MFFNGVGIVIFLSVSGIVTSNPDRSVDCRKFVFAPLCRGVAAKRSIFNERMNFGNNESYKPLVKLFPFLMKSSALEDNESLKPQINPFQLAMRQLTREDYESFIPLEKPIIPAIKSISPQDNDRACETF